MPAPSYLTVWTSRNYRANRHLEVLNLHRCKTLITFKTFVASAKDDATKNAILLEATRCIVSVGPTGYSGDDGGSSPAQFVEIVKTFTGGKQ